MFKRSLILLVCVMPFFLTAESVHFYRNGEKIVLEENFSAKRSGDVYPAYQLKGGHNYYINNNIFVKIPGMPALKDAKSWCENNGFKLVRQYKYIPQWYLVSYSGNTIKKAAELVESRAVEQAEPSFYLPLELKSFTPDDPFFANQWHLHNPDGASMGYTGNDSAHVLEAWNVLLAVKGHKGTGVKLAIVDDGFDLDHEDLSGRFLPGHDFGDNDELPYPGAQDAHGTCVAGVAGATTDNATGVAGACPDCSLIPIRMRMTASSLDSIAIEAFEWAADAGADIISNSWGPTDGGGAVDMGQPLKDLVANLTTQGRGGKGIIILFAAGNGGESVEGDGFASNPNVFAIGASNASGKRSSYSDFGMPLDFMAPSNDVDNSQGGDGWSGGGYLDGIWTTDNTNAGYNPGQLQGDATGKYVSEFGGTSSACPLAAGITGLVLSANPDLTRDQVYDIFKTTADKVSMGAVNPGEGDYDENGFSTHYGFGRINACEAVKKALEIGGTDVSKIVCGEDIEPVDDSDQPVTDNENNDDITQDDTEIDDNSNFEDDEVVPVGKRADDGCSCSFISL